MVPITDGDRHILKLANSFVAAEGATHYAVPLRIEPSPIEDRIVAVIYWTPRQELQLLGSRAVIVNTESETVEFAMRD